MRGDTVTRPSIPNYGRRDDGGEPKSISVSEKLNSCYLVCKLFRDSRPSRARGRRFGLGSEDKLGDITILICEIVPELFQAAAMGGGSFGCEPRNSPIGVRRADPTSATKPEGNFSWLQALEKSRNANGISPASSRAPAIAGHAGRTRVRRIRRDETARKFSWLQALEKSRNAEGISLRFRSPIGGSRQ